jgi:hypothetical protein
VGVGERERERLLCNITKKAGVVCKSPIACAYLYKHEIGEHSRRRRRWWMEREKSEPKSYQLVCRFVDRCMYISEACR